MKPTLRNSCAGGRFSGWLNAHSNSIGLTHLKSLQKAEVNGEFLAWLRLDVAHAALVAIAVNTVCVLFRQKAIKVDPDLNEILNRHYDGGVEVC